MKQQQYFIGLDIGVQSVGFAVTDERYQLIKKGKKELWGTRLFESGNTAVERRTCRAARRRIERKKMRLQLLRSFFQDEIMKIDPTFFARLDESMYHVEDKQVMQSNTLFNDAGYQDKQFHHDYPTAFHLRQALLQGKVDDVRSLYLGLAHILKSRGHFLFMGQEFSEISKFQTAYDALNQHLVENHPTLALPIEDVPALELILQNAKSNMTVKEKSILSLFGCKPEPEQKQLVKLMVGGSISLNKLFEDQSLDQEFLKTKISFKKGFDEKHAELEQNLGEYIILINLVKAIYDWAVLSDILSGYQYLSESKVAIFGEHKHDLALLKQMVRKYAKDDYKEIFTEPNRTDNYPAYIGMTRVHGKNLPLEKSKCSQEDLCVYLFKKLGQIVTDDPDEQQVLQKITDKKLLPKQVIKDNGVIPYQVHLKELQGILAINAGKFPFLNQQESGISIAQKIEKTFLYRIPYYVGTLNPHAKTHWMVRKTAEKITPWNFEDVVDLSQSAEAFILRMTNNCSYLKNADVLPKQSLLYSKYMVLNELNNIKINGKSIDPTLKQALYHDLFENNSKVSIKKVKDHLIRNCLADKSVEVTGLADNEFKASLKTHMDFTKIFGVYDVKMAEDIIRWIVLFSDDKKILKTKISENYTLTKEQLQDVMKLRYSGWGNLSTEFLTTIYDVDPNTGEAINIIDALYQTNQNLMQLLSKEHGYIQALNDRNKSEAKTTISHQDIEGLYCSPAVKKSIWQTVQVVQELEKIMGGKPAKLFIEVARDVDGMNAKQRTTSRKNALLELYQSIKKEEPALYERLSNSTDNDLRSKKLYLYYTQLGRCAYSDRPIDLAKLFDQNQYDIEHIYPRSKTKDDSLHNNLVLVERTLNSKKSDAYPIPGDYRQPTLWKGWYEKGLINKEKYQRLIRVEEFNDKELEGFINRQLVETRQSTKAVGQLFQQYYENCSSEVVYVKAGHVSDFRKQFDFVKVRELNDYHHAKDAYLNAVVGNVFHTKFTKRFFQHISTNKYTLNPEKLYQYDVKQGDYYAWKAPTKGDTGSMDTIRKTMASNRILFTRQAIKQTGKLFKATILKKGHGEFAVKNPTNPEDQRYKLTDLSKYGGYNSIYGSYFCVVEHELKGQKNRTIEYVPIYLANQIEQNPDKLLDYLQSELKLLNPRIILRELKTNALVNIDGFPMHLSGRTGDRLIFKGAVQLLVDNETEQYLKKVSRFVARTKENPQATLSEKDVITVEQNLAVFDLFLDKLGNSVYTVRLQSSGKKLLAKQEKFQQLSREDQCRVLLNMLNFFGCRAGATDGSLLGEGKSMGILVLSKNITKCKKVTLINQSITGVYENKIDLLK